MRTLFISGLKMEWLKDECEWRGRRKKREYEGKCFRFGIRQLLFGVLGQLHMSELQIKSDVFREIIIM